MTGRFPGLQAAALLASTMLMVGCIGPGEGNVTRDDGSASGTASRDDRLPVPTSGWLEYHPDWQVGNAVPYGGNVTHLEENISWAGDGVAFLYVRPVNVTADRGVCYAAGQPPGAWVLVSPVGCMWVRHPAFACAAFCREVFGTAVSAGHELMTQEPQPT